MGPGGFALCVDACGPAGVPGAGGPGRCVCRWAAARPRDRHTRACGSEWSISRPALALPPPTGTAARPCVLRLARALRSLWRPPHQWGWVALNGLVRLRCRPRPPQPGPPVPPAPSTPVGPGVLACGLVRRLEAPLQLLIINFARNSFMAHSNIECASLELQRFWGVSKNDRDKLRAKCGWWWCRRRPRRRSQALSARWPACLKPPSPLRAQAEPQLKPLSPLRAPAEPQMKPASPLRVRIGCFWRVFRLHW